ADEPTAIALDVRLLRRPFDLENMIAGAVAWRAPDRRGGGDSDDGNRPVRTLDIVGHQPVIMAMQDQFSADAANHALEIICVRQSAPETRSVPMGRMMDEDDAHMPRASGFGQKLGRRLALPAAEAAGGDEGRRRNA